MRAPNAAARGFTLVEALVASTTVLVAVAALAQLVAATALTARRARAVTLAAVFAQEKLETLLPWAVDERGLTASPPDTLDRDVAGYVDFLDVTGSDAATAAAAAYIRRWAIEPLLADGGRTLVIRVVVLDARGGGATAQAVTAVR